MASEEIAYIAGGKLFLYRDGGSTPIESPFVQTLVAREERNREANSWRAGSLSWNLGAGPQLMALQVADVTGDPRSFWFTGVARVAPGELVYTLESPRAGGLFRLQTSSGDERRLVHRQEFRVADVAFRPGCRSFVVARRASDGTSHLALLGESGGPARQITDGDVIDESPSWVIEPDQPAERQGQIVYQSAGLARDHSGGVIARGPYAILKLDLDADRLSTLAEFDASDALAPRMDGAGNLFYIRRPYQPFGPRAGAVTVLKDIVLFPFRLAATIVRICDVYAQAYTQRPLITPRPPNPEPVNRFMLIHGAMIDAQRSLKKHARDGHLVDADWVLVKRRADGAETELASHVVAFDLLPGGAVLTTNGTRIHRHDPDGKILEIASGHLIERIVGL